MVGSPRSWTVLAADGSYVRRKIVWWKADFAAGGEEPMPEIAVAAAPITAGPPGTNAYTAEDGWFMIVGIDPEAGGCWELTARYRNAELSYVYFVS